MKSATRKKSSIFFVLRGNLVAVISEKIRYLQMAITRPPEESGRGSTGPGFRKNLAFQNLEKKKVAFERSMCQSLSEAVGDLCCAGYTFVAAGI